jgi:histone-lysine N-methyltransferase SETMAR
MTITQLTEIKEVFQKLRIKTILFTFFNSKGIIHKEFMPEDRSVNSEYYLEVLKYLLMIIKHVKQDMDHSGCWCLHDNIPAHTAINVRIFLAKKGIAALNHPPYSPDLAPADIFLFPQVETEIERSPISYDQ